MAAGRWGAGGLLPDLQRHLPAQWLPGCGGRSGPSEQAQSTERCRADWVAPALAGGGAALRVDPGGLLPADQADAAAGLDR